MSRSKEKHREYMRRWRAARRLRKGSISVRTGILDDNRVSQHSVGLVSTVTLGNVYTKPDSQVVVHLVNDSDRARKVLERLGYKQS